jgi:DNA-binding FrmR family transcriptional regulator
MSSARHKTTHDEQLQRLSRVEGQVRGVRRMVEEGAYCVDIMTQVQAATSALRAVGRQILQKHIEHCLADAVRSGSEDAFREKVEEIMQIVKKGQ